MARYTCQRCEQVCHTTEPEHLCKDIARRLARRQAQKDAVLAVFSSWGLLDGFEDTKDRLAEAVVKALAGLDVSADV